MHKIWYDKAWDDYQYWLTQDRKTEAAVLYRLGFIFRAFVMGLCCKIASVNAHISEY